MSGLTRHYCTYFSAPLNTTLARFHNHFTQNRTKSYKQVCKNSFSQATPLRLLHQDHCHPKPHTGNCVQYWTSKFRCRRAQHPQPHRPTTDTQYHRDWGAKATWGRSNWCPQILRCNVFIGKYCSWQTQPSSALWNICLLASNVSEHLNHRKKSSISLIILGYGTKQCESAISVLQITIGPRQKS